MPFYSPSCSPVPPPPPAEGLAELSLETQVRRLGQGAVCWEVQPSVCRSEKGAWRQTGSGWPADVPSAPALSGKKPSLGAFQPRC